MGPEAKWQTALRVLVEELRRAYGSRLDGVVLYGSRARGDGTDDSDVDVLVVLRALGDPWVEIERIGPIADRLSLRFDTVISALPVDASAFESSKMPWLRNARLEGHRVA